MLIKGSNLNSKQRQQVLAAFVHRHTVEHPYPPSGVTRIQTQDWQLIATIANLLTLQESAYDASRICRAIARSLWNWQVCS